MDGIVTLKGILVPSKSNILSIIGDDCYVPVVGKYRGMEIEKINVLFGKQLGSLVKNPITGEWWVLDHYGSPWIIGDNHYRPIICHKQKWICFIIPKNGCSSIVKSAHYYDGDLTDEEFKSDMFIWDARFTERNERRKMEYHEVKMIDSAYSDYKKFIVLTDEKDRVMRWINWNSKHQYNKFYSYGLSDDDLLEEFFWSMKFIAFANPNVCDQHLLPQRCFIEKWNILYENMKDVEVVQLSELPVWYEKAFGSPLIKNNVTSPSEKRYDWNRLTDNQRQQILDWCALYGTMV